MYQVINIHGRVLAEVHSPSRAEFFLSAFRTAEPLGVYSVRWVA